MEWFLCYLFAQTNDDLHICKRLLNDTSEHRKIFSKFQWFVRMACWWWTNKTFWYKCISKRDHKLGFYSIGNVHVGSVKNDNHWYWLLGEFPNRIPQIKTLTRFPVLNSSNAIQRLLLLIDKVIQSVPIGIWRFLNPSMKPQKWLKLKFKDLINYDFVAVVAQLVVCLQVY